MPTPDLYPTSTQYDFRLSGTRPALAVTADGGHFAASGVIGYDEAPTISLFERLAGNPRMPYAVLPEPAPVLGMAFSADGSKLFVVERDSGVVLRVLSSPLQAGSIISLDSTFSEIQIGDSLDYGANLSFSDGTSALGKAVALTLTDPAGHQTSLGTVTADGQGDVVKSLPDAFDQAGDWFLRAAYPGDATHQRTAATKRIIVAKRNATLDIGVTSTPLMAGTTTTVSGTLTLLGPDGVAGRDVAVYATPPGGSEALIGTAVAGATGAYSIDTLVDAGGVWSFRAAYAGDSRYAPAAAGPFEVTADRQHAQVSIAARRTLVTYGSKVTVTATLGATHTNRVVQIVRIAPNGSRAIIAEGPVDADGHFQFLAGPSRPTATWHSSPATRGSLRRHRRRSRSECDPSCRWSRGTPTGRSAAFVGSTTRPPV